ncbi:MAG TPA: transcription elongation factor GreA, partial [Micrococcaceae bacterium]
MSTSNSAPAAWLTQEAFDRLKAELDHLSGPGRAEIVKKIEQARSEGDLKENGGYHAAKDEQGKIEARIRQLTELLRDAHVGEAPADDGIVEPGMMVVAKIAGEKTTFLLGS